MKYKKGYILKYVYCGTDTMFIIDDVDLVGRRYRIITQDKKEDHGYFDSDFIYNKKFFKLHKVPQKTGW